MNAFCRRSPQISPSNTMEQIYGGSVLQRVLRAKNQKEERDLQRKLSVLDKQRSNACKTLRRRSHWLREEAGRVAAVKLCQPKATVHVAMKEIRELKSAGLSRGVRTSDGSIIRRKQESEAAEQSRSVSAPPPPPVKPSSSLRRRRHIQSGLSFMQVKNVAAIDSIAEKELVGRQQKAQEDSGGLRQLHGETLHTKVAAFIRDKGSVERTFHLLVNLKGKLHLHAA